MADRRGRLQGAPYLDGAAARTRWPQISADWVAEEPCNTLPLTYKGLELWTRPATIPRDQPGRSRRMIELRPFWVDICKLGQAPGSPVRSPRPAPARQPTATRPAAADSLPTRMGKRRQGRGPIPRRSACSRDSPLPLLAKPRRRLQTVAISGVAPQVIQLSLKGCPAAPCFRPGSHFLARFVDQVWDREPTLAAGQQSRPTAGLPIGGGSSWPAWQLPRGRPSTDR